MIERKIIHQELTPERWFKLSLIEQLGNIGSDVDRAISWKKRGNIENCNQAINRALELFYLTIADPKNKGARLRELLRVRAVLADYFYGINEYDFTEEWFHQYFFNFAYMAALQKGK